MSNQFVPAGLQGVGLIVWVVYRNPSDFPGWWVLRPQEATGGVVAGRYACLSRELAALHGPLEERGLTMLPRQRDDDPVIFETWF